MYTGVHEGVNVLGHTHTQRSLEDAGCPALSFSTALRWGLLLNLELDWQPPSPSNLSLWLPWQRGYRLCLAFSFSARIWTKGLTLSYHMLFLFMESSFQPQDRDVFEGRNNSAIHSLLFYPSPSYKWFILHYFFQHKEACVSAMILNRCFDFSICDHGVVLQILA